MTWLAAILLAPVALAILAIALPFHAAVRGAVRDGEPSGLARVAWAFGLVAVELRPGGARLLLAGAPVARLRARRGERAAPRRERAREERRERTGRHRARARVGGAVSHRAPLLRIAARVLRALHLRLRVRGRIGTGDPADTAALAGVLQAARALPGIELEVEVDWLDEVLEGEADGAARVWLPELLAVAGLLMLRRPNRAAVRALAG